MYAMKGIVKGTLCLMLAFSSVLSVRAEEKPEQPDIITEETAAEELPEEETEETGEETPEEPEEEQPAEEAAEEENDAEAGEEQPEETPETEEITEPEETPETEEIEEPEQPEEDPVQDSIPEENAEEPAETEPAVEPADSILQTAPQGTVTFVHQLYTGILDREPDQEGWKTWVKVLLDGTEASEVIKQFTNSEEFQNMVDQPVELVKSLYRGILGREGSDSEAASWASRLSDGQTYHALLQGFIGSPEFHSRCASYELKPGSYASPYYVDKNIKATRFVMSLYRILLKRDAEFGGLEGWTKRLLTGMTGSVVICSILDSAEFQTKIPSNEEYVTMLYQAVLGREGSSSEVSGWAVKMNNGQTYRAMMQGFINSQEFKKRCADIGIQPGTYKSPRYADMNYNVTLFVTTLFRSGLGRNGSESDIENRTKQLLTKALTGAAVVRIFLNSAECKNRNLSNENYVSMLYITVLGRARGDASVGSSWVKLLNQGTTRPAVLNKLLASAEFKTRCQKLGILWDTVQSTAVTQYTPWRYLQGDSRWGSVRIGSYTIARTGCVPTSIAMALSGIFNTSIYPDTVARWLYNNTQEYNRIMHGGSGAANLYAAKAWNASAYGIDSASALTNALARGYIVTAIVGPGTFTGSGTTHEIVLWGSSAGSCNVYDPLGKTGKYSISSIWSQRSFDSYDLRGGYVFYAIYK